MTTEPITEVKIPNDANPIVDDQTTLDELYRAGRVGDEPVEKEAGGWEEPLTKMAESQASLTALVERMAENYEKYNQAPRERVVERVPYERPAPEPEPEWRSQIKPEQVKILDEAIATGIQRGIKNFKDTEVMPALQYITSVQERLLERELADKYDDESFGYGVLKDESKAYRAASGYNIDLETAYSRVAFDKMVGALKGSRQAQAESARQQKAAGTVDEGGTGPGKAEGDEELAPEERRAARSFFAGQDPRTGKLRSQQEIDELWMEHKKGAKRDELPD